MLLIRIRDIGVHAQALQGESENNPVDIILSIIYNVQAYLNESTKTTYFRDQIKVPACPGTR